MKKIIISSFAFIALFAACKKAVDPKVTVTFSSPAEAAEFMSGNPVNVKASIVSTDSLHEYGLNIINITSGDTLVDWEIHHHELTANIDSTYSFIVTAHSEMKITVHGTDHNDISGTAVRNFHVMP